MPHTDGPMFYPTICTISLGSHAVLDFYSESDKVASTEEPDREARTDKQDRAASTGEENKVVDKTRRHVTSLLVKPRSLLVLKEKMYHELLHGISEVTDQSKHSILTN